MNQEVIGNFVDPKDTKISDDGETIREFLDRFSESPSGQLFALEGSLQAALRRGGFRETNLRFIRSRKHWKFEMNLGPDQNFKTAGATATCIYVAFRNAVHPVLRQSISARLSGRKLSGTFMLKSKNGNSKKWARGRNAVRQNHPIRF
jgi:hypothetical protein